MIKKVAEEKERLMRLSNGILNDKVREEVQQSIRDAYENAEEAENNIEAQEMDAEELEEYVMGSFDGAIESRIEERDVSTDAWTWLSENCDF